MPRPCSLGRILHTVELAGCVWSAEGGIDSGGEIVRAKIACRCTAHGPSCAHCWQAMKARLVLFVHTLYPCVWVGCLWVWVHGSVRTHVCMF